jgi:hypothetical protein
VEDLDKVKYGKDHYWIVHWKRKVNPCKVWLKVTGQLMAEIISMKGLKQDCKSRIISK